MPDVDELPADLMTPREVRQTLNIASTTLDRWVLQGKITPLLLPNGYRRFRRSDVLALLQPRAAS